MIRVIACPNGHQNPADEVFCAVCEAVMPPVTSAPGQPDLIRWVDATLPAEQERPAPESSDAVEDVRPTPRAVLMSAKRKPWYRKRLARLPGGRRRR
jgi:hypothetical protein